jgi:hypothetical protein
MRLTLIAVFSVVVLLVGGLSYVLARTMIGKAADPAVATQALTAAAAQIRVEGLATERWLAARALDPKVRQPFTLGTDRAKGDAATEAANGVRETAATSGDMQGIQPALVCITDEKGVVLGRNGSGLMRGDDLGKIYPGLKASLDAGVPGSDVWINKSRSEQYFASYAPVRSEDGKLMGALVVASLINDERINGASTKTSGEALVLAVKSDSGVQVVAKSANAGPFVASVEAKPGSDGVLKVLETAQPLDLAGFPSGHVAAGRNLEGYGDGKRAALVAIAAPKGGATIDKLLLPILGVTALGIVLIIIAASMIDSWIARPIQDMEEILLAIINGKPELRIELEHPMLGGLAFRINSLLNQLLGVQEDNTDEQGRDHSASRPPPEPNPDLSQPPGDPPA